MEVRALPHAVHMLLDTWAPIVRALDDVGHRLTPSQQTVVCAFLDAINAVLERPPDDC